jgi:hypothetical protein
MPPEARRGPSGRFAFVLVAFVLALLCSTSVAAAAPCDAPVQSVIACENSRPGAPPSDWQVSGTGDPTITGFTTAMSVRPGDTVGFKIKTPAARYHVDILRLGYYGGDGARIVSAGLRPGVALPQTQPACRTDAGSGLIDCGNWAVSLSWTVPATAVSGVYLAHLVREDTGGDSLIPFVVRDETRQSAMVVQTSDTTWQAYNAYGGNSLYSCTVACPAGDPLAYKAAYKVSYNRPFDKAGYDGGSNFLFSSEYPMIRFLEANGYDVSYVAGIDVERRGPQLRTHRLFVSSGHDEYWSAGQRANVEAARDAGVNLAFFSGNEVFWKTRWEPSIDAGATPDRTLVSYKDTHFAAPQDPVAWTGTWRDPRFSPPADGGRPENALTGQIFRINSGSAALTVPYAFRALRLWRNTAVQGLTPGQSLTLAPQSLGYEWDEDPDNGFRPAGQFRLSSTTVSGVEVFTDYGTTTALGTATHNLTLHRATSGALVFGAGTVQWAWGLDAENPIGNQPDPTMRQATVNLFADMGVQMASPQPGLQAAVASTDTTAPTSAITSPAAGATVADGTVVTVTGTASGGTVAGVEVSTDGGDTWHPATGTSSWTYRWSAAHGHPRAVIRSRAVDDSGNLETPSPGTTLNVSCPCSLWGTAINPAQPDAGDPNAVEVGLKFRTDTFGTITGLRFYKAQANTGTHVGSLWTAGGQRLAQATFTNESASGWQTVTFADPVLVDPGTTYVVSYFAPAGHYAVTSGYLHPAPAPPPSGGAVVDSPPLHALRSSGSIQNGVYRYTGTSAFPASSFGASNYWVDPVFVPAQPPGQVTGVSATAGLQSATVSWTRPSGGGPVSSYKITPYIGTAAQTPTTAPAPATSATVRPLTGGQTYTFKVTAINANGAGPDSAASDAVTISSTATAPSAPTAVSAQPGKRSALVEWAAPTDDGGQAVTGYTVTPYAGGVAQAPVTVSGTPPAIRVTMTGLQNGTAYRFGVRATNATGTSAQSAQSAAVTPRDTIFDFGVPAVADSGDGSPIEVGVKFRADRSGVVTGVRFYKAAANTGTHTGSLWTAAGQRLAQATFSNETASGWQHVTFASAVPVTADTTYVASYFAPNGRYSATTGALGNGVSAPPLTAVANSQSANGVYLYSPSTMFPANSYRATSYSVDVLFAASPPGQVTGASAMAGYESASVSWAAPTTGGPATSYAVTPYVGTVAQTPTTVAAPATSASVRGLTGGQSYTFRVTATNADGAGPPSAASNAVLVAGPAAPGPPTGVTAQPGKQAALVRWTAPADDGGRSITGYTVTPYVGSAAQTPATVSGSATSAVVPGLTNGTAYAFRVTAANAVGGGPASAATAAVAPRDTLLEFTTPATVDSGDPGPIEVGLKFRADRSGQVTGVRFYKAAANTGTHVGSLWTADGQRLAQVTLADESASGWQSATFASPVPVTADTTYVVSYFAPAGHYAYTGAAFASGPLVNAPLTALSNVQSPNGVYAYTAAAGTFPTSSYNATNYWVDVLFAGGA